MAKNRRSQHRPRSESKTPKAKELDALRSENRKLKTENARLRRRLQKEFDVLNDTGVTEASEPAPVAASQRQEPIQFGRHCENPGCLSQEVKILSLGALEFIICTKCIWRKRV